MELQQDSIFLEHPKGHQIHLKRWFTNPEGQAIWMLHGSIENGRIFYSNSGKGLAPYLATKGFDVYVMDLRGRGESTPPIDKNSDFGHYDVMEEDFPLVLNWLKTQKNGRAAHWMAHSWGGVLQLAFLARYENPLPVDKMVFFGTKRKISVLNFSKLLYINLFWNTVFAYYIKKYGYLPAKLPGGLGSEKETVKSYSETSFWVNADDWKDQRDGFDYSAKLKTLSLPDALYLTGEGDKVLGNPKDVQRLIDETGHSNASIKVVGKSTRFKKNYGHIDIMTDKIAAEEVFPLAYDFLIKKL